jgi:hypothetical protein
MIHTTSTPRFRATAITVLAVPKSATRLASVRKAERFQGLQTDTDDRHGGLLLLGPSLKMGLQIRREGSDEKKKIFESGSRGIDRSF